MIKPVRFDCDIDKINRPSHLRRAILFDLFSLSTSRASPNDMRIIVIIVIVIIIGEAEVLVHDGGIIAHSYIFSSNLIERLAAVFLLHGCKACVRWFISKLLPIHLKMLYIYFAIQSIDSKGE